MAIAAIAAVQYAWRRGLGGEMLGAGWFRRAAGTAAITAAAIASGSGAAYAVEVCTTPGVPALPKTGFLILGGLLLAVGVFFAYRQRPGGASPSKIALMPVAGSLAGLLYLRLLGAMMTVEFLVFLAGFTSCVESLARAVARRPWWQRQVALARGQFSRKLGRCTFCMRWALRGTAVWASLVVTSLIFDAPSFVLGASVLLLAAFGALTTAHAFSFTRRMVGSVGTDEDEDQLSVNRRAFLSSAARSSAIGLIAMFGFPRLALAAANATTKCCLYEINFIQGGSNCPETFTTGVYIKRPCPPDDECCHDYLVCNNSQQQQLACTFTVLRRTDRCTTECDAFDTATYQCY